MLDSRWRLGVSLAREKLPKNWTGKFKALRAEILYRRVSFLIIFWINFLLISAPRGALLVSGVAALKILRKLIQKIIRGGRQILFSASF